MRIDFLNVGHGDCIVIEHASGNLTVVDINNGSELDSETLEEIANYYNNHPIYNIFFTQKSSIKSYGMLKEAGYDIELTNPIEHLKKQYPGRDIFRYIQTHPHFDHMRGIEQLRENNIKIVNFWDTDHNFVPDSQTDSDKTSWDEYQRLRKSLSSPNVLRLYRETPSNIYWAKTPDGKPGGDGIEILHPSKNPHATIEKSDNVNNLSYVLRVTIGGVKIILGGDAEGDVWDDLVKTYGARLKCDILKASHHGRKSGFHEEAIKLMKPEYTIVSVGKKPDTDASPDYRKYSKNVWSTRWKGNIYIKFDTDGKPKISPQYDR